MTNEYQEIENYKVRDREWRLKERVTRKAYSVKETTTHSKEFRIEYCPLSLSLRLSNPFFVIVSYTSTTWSTSTILYLYAQQHNLDMRSKTKATTTRLSDSNYLSIITLFVTPASIPLLFLVLFFILNFLTDSCQPFSFLGVWHHRLPQISAHSCHL